jgi:hypothetical protein
VVERGDQAALMGQKGVYERQIALQAQGYR